LLMQSKIIRRLRQQLPAAPFFLPGNSAFNPAATPAENPSRHA
jgi:hypothetical protein